MREFEISVNPEPSKRDFRNVLNRVLSNRLNPTYTISQLEFEFDLKWEYLKTLLDEYCVYKQDGDKVVIEHEKEKEEAEDKPETLQEIQERKEVLLELKRFFFKTGTYRRVRIKNLASINEKLRYALDYGLERGIVKYYEDKRDKTHIFALHHFVRLRNV